MGRSYGSKPMLTQMCPKIKLIVMNTGKGMVIMRGIGSWQLWRDVSEGIGKE